MDYARKTQERIEERDAARALLDKDPTNLDLAWSYWHACGELRSGRDVSVAFTKAALRCRAGAVAYVRAYRQLSDDTGEGPRLAYVTPAVLEAVRVLRPEPETVEAELIALFLQGLAP